MNSTVNSKDKIWDWRLFLVEGSLWNARGFQTAAPVNKFDVLCVGCGKTRCIILCSKAIKNGCVPKWCLGLCSKVILLPSRTVDHFSLQILKPGFRMMLWSSGALVEYRICILNQPADAIEFNFGRKKWGLHWLPCKIQMVVTGGRKAVCRRGVRVSYQSARITIIFFPSIIRIWLRICKVIADPWKKLNDDNGGIMDLELWCVWTCSSEAIWDALPGNTLLGFGNCKKSWIAWSETVTETGTETVPMPRLEMTKKKKTSTTSLAMRAMEESWFETASSNGGCHAWIKVLTTFTYIYYAITEF